MAGRRDVEAGSAYVRLYMKQTAFNRGLRSLQRNLKSIGGGFSRVGKTISGVGLAIVGSITAAAAAFAKFGDTLNKMSARTGVSVEALSELKFAAEQSGASIEDLGMVIQKMNRRVGRVTAGQGSSVETAALEELGLVIADLAKMNPEERFLAIADAMATYGDNAAAAGLAQRAFGTGVDKLLPLIFAGKEGIEALREEARELGLVMSEEDAAAAAELTDAWNRLKQAGLSAFLKIGSAIGPVFTNLADMLTGLAVRVQSWINDNREMVVMALKVGAAITVFGAALAGIGLTLSTAATAIGGFMAAMPFAPAILAISAAVGVVTAAYALWGDEIKAVVLPALAKLKEIFVRDVLPAFKKLGTAIKDDLVPALKDLGPAITVVVGAFAKLQTIQVSVAMKAFALWAEGISISLKAAAEAKRYLSGDDGGSNVPGGTAPPSAALQAKRDRDAFIGGRSDIPRLGNEGRERQAEREAITEAEREAREIESFFGSDRNTPGEQSAIDDFFAGKESETPEPEDSTAKKLADWIKYAVGVVGGDKPPPPETAAAAAIGPHGTFSTSAALAMSGAAGGGPEERTAKSTEALVTLMTTLTGLSKDQLTAIKNAFTFK